MVDKDRKDCSTTCTGDIPINQLQPSHDPPPITTPEASGTFHNSDGFLRVATQTRDTTPRSMKNKELQELNGNYHECSISTQITIIEINIMCSFFCNTKNVITSLLEGDQGINAFPACVSTVGAD